MVSVNKHRFFSSNSFVRISYKTIWLKRWSWYKNPLKNESWKGLKWCFAKDAHQKRGKTISSATFCATSVWGLTSSRPFFDLWFIIEILLPTDRKIIPRGLRDPRFLSSQNFWNYYDIFRKMITSAFFYESNFDKWRD